MFKKISTSFIGITLASLAISPAFAQDDAATAAIKNLDPLSHQLTWDKCDYANPLLDYSKTDKESGLVALLGTAIITKGVDLIGNLIKSSGEEKTYSAAASLNVVNVQKQGCLLFKRTGYYEFLIAMPKAGNVGELVNPSLVEYSYTRSVNGDKRGERGLTLEIIFSRPGSTETQSQSVILGNLDVESKLRDRHKLRHSIPLMYNPFYAKEENGLADDTSPFTVTVKITEVKDANQLYKFVGDVADDVNDDVTTLLIKAVGLNDDDDAGDNAAEQPPSLGGS